jgi:glycosidase
MQWSTAAGAGFTAGIPWEAPQPDWVSKNVAGEDRDPGSLLNHYRKLIHLRNQHPALNEGDLQQGVASAAAVAAFVRHSPKETILVALNFGDQLIDRVTVVFPRAQPGGQFRLEPLYNDPSSGCFVTGMMAGGAAITLGNVAPHSLCTFRVLSN